MVSGKSAFIMSVEGVLNPDNVEALENRRAKASLHNGTNTPTLGSCRINLETDLMGKELVGY